eukprot:gene42745-31906_t
MSPPTQRPAHQRKKGKRRGVGGEAATSKEKEQLHSARHA